MFTRQISTPRFLRASVAAVALFVATQAHALDGDDTAAFNLVEENDSHGSGSDKHYTQGLRLAFASAETAAGKRADLADLLLLLPKTASASSGYRYGVFVGQSIFTPADIADSTPDPNDRPYAGWLYAGATLYRQSGNVLDRAEITVGIVGPSARGEQVQNAWHVATRGVLNLDRAQGWDAQLHNEFGVVLTEERKWRFAGTAGRYEVDLVPEVNASIGNIFTYAAAGGLVRFGRHLAVDWGPPRVQPALAGSDFVNAQVLGGDGFAWYAFAGTEARLVARNIFLDGNTFQDSASVTRKPFVADLTAGVTAVFQHGRATVSYVRRSEEFTTQDGYDQFLSITLAYLW